MSIIPYYRSLMNQGDLNANYLVYKARVEAAGGSILDETNCNARFQFMDDNSIYADYRWGLGNYAGNTLDGSSNVEAFFDMSTQNLDTNQSTPSLRPTSAYEFGGSSSSGFRDGTSESISELTWAFQLGTIGVNTGFEVIFADGAGTGGSGLLGVVYRWNDNTYVFSVQGQIIFSATTVLSNDKVLVTRSAGGLIVYVNDVQVVSVASSAPFNVLNDNGIGALSTSPVQFFNGQIIEFHKFHSDLNALHTEIHDQFLI